MPGDNFLLPTNFQHCFVAMWNKVMIVSVCLCVLTNPVIPVPRSTLWIDLLASRPQLGSCSKRRRSTFLHRLANGIWCHFANSKCLSLTSLVGTV